MSEHPIESLMKTAMENIKEMIDVDTIVGEPVESPDGQLIIPISRVSCGFAAGGGDYFIEQKDSEGKQEKPEAKPFGGGSGGGVSVKPVGFLIVGNKNVKFLSVDGGAIYDRLLDLAPELVSQIKELLKKDPDKRQQKREYPGNN